ncbi:MAG: aryl-sulfate sulfotransferase [Ignavibacteria bacterium]|nr:aryl-sulfate sulfotransferase [Ignavibacteria bacterium]MBT8382993.1 aryl-sulfate sulfotransferase [Ignavibacteria bacterium]MBT8391614.1 aryl-sulfate sulfotransferase [Ignavibacteria bacterium]NNL22007.1 T9SS type A sorting domain-containing protein [Ignavibacteriaceae bacterium]
MFKIYFRFTLTVLTIILAPLTIMAQTQTVGLFINDSSSFNGYTFFAPAAYTNTYLINNEGLLVNSWASTYTPALSAYLLDNGNLLRTATISNSTFSGGGSGGLIQEFDWDNNLIWEFEYSTNQVYQHHDVEKLPNGNVLVVAWELKNLEEVLGAGRNPNLLAQNFLWPDHIVEVEPSGINGGSVVWEWHVWDHLIQDYDPGEENYGVVSEHPELVDINYVSANPGGTNADWNHINSVAYNDELDQIILTIHKFNEIWVIDHSTTTEEAAGHTGGNSGMGGDLLYRWGNPKAYKRGDVTDQKLFAMHDAHWIADSLPGGGNILIFNNGRFRPGGNFSTVDEIAPPVDVNGNYTLNPDSTYGPDSSFWTYVAPNPLSFFAANISGSQRQPNGNTLICDGPAGEFFEVTPNGEIVWQYINPVIASGPMRQGDPIPVGQNRVFRTYRYAPDYPGFIGKDLTPGDPIELDPISSVFNNLNVIPTEFRLFQNHPNPFNPSTIIQYTIPRNGFVTLTVYNLLGKLVATLVNEQKSAGNYEILYAASELSSGIYFYKLSAGNFIDTKKMLLLK